MTIAEVKAIAEGIREIDASEARERAVQAVLPALYQYAGKKFNAVQFCIDCDVPALIG